MCAVLCCHSRYLSGRYLRGTAVWCPRQSHTFVSRSPSRVCFAHFIFVDSFLGRLSSLFLSLPRSSRCRRRRMNILFNHLLAQNEKAKTKKNKKPTIYTSNNNVDAEKLSTRIERRRRETQRHSTLKFVFYTHTNDSFDRLARTLIAADLTFASLLLLLFLVNRYSVGRSFIRSCHAYVREILHHQQKYVRAHVHDHRKFNKK